MSLACSGVGVWSAPPSLNRRMCRTVYLKALCKVELKAMLNGMVEIISGRERRRRWGVEAKLRIVAETQEAGPCVREGQPGTTFTQACCTTGGDRYARVGLSRHTC